MKRFVYYFKPEGLPEWEDYKARVYATPVTVPGRKIQALRRANYSAELIEGGEGWQFLLLSIWEAAPVGFRPGAYLIHPEHAEVLKLSEDWTPWAHPESWWAQLAQYAERKYNDYLKNI